MDVKTAEIRAMLDAVRECGFEVHGRQVLEIGTGWDPVAALFLAALGAQVTTTDQWRHVRTTDIVRRSVGRALGPMREQGGLTREQAGALSACEAGTLSVDGLLEAFGIRYLAPVPDDIMLTMPPASFDLVFSIAVLEHVRPKDLETVIRGQQHVLKTEGIAYHDIGLGDHFAGVDPVVTFASFLQFDEGPMWRILGENALAYHNRLRRTDYTRLFAGHGWDEAWAAAQVDPKSHDMLRSGELRPARSHFQLEMKRGT